VGLLLDVAVVLEDVKFSGGSHGKVLGNKDGLWEVAMELLGLGF